MTILSKDDITGLKSMIMYWDEVSAREDTSPLSSELHYVVGLLGRKILWIIKDYIRLLEKEMKNEKVY